MKITMKQEKTTSEDAIPAVLLGAREAEGRVVFHPFKRIKTAYKVLAITSYLTRILMKIIRSHVTVRSHTLAAQWLSAALAVLGSTLRVRKWKGLQFLMCGTAPCVKQKVQKVEQNLEQEKQGAGKWQVLVLLQGSSSDRVVVKKSRTNLWRSKQSFEIQILSVGPVIFITFAHDYLSKCSCY